MKAIDINGLSFSYGEKRILDDIYWSIEKGEIAVIVGPNGCGKSTLLRLIAGLVDYNDGKIKIFEKDVKNYGKKELARKIAFMPQQQEMPKDMTVYELVSCGRFPYKSWWQISDNDDEKIILDVIKSVGLSHLKDCEIGKISGGECQRVNIAMALAQEPEILVLDEPTTYLDINYQLEILNIVKNLNEKTDLTVVMVLHDLNHAASYADKVGILNNKKLVKTGIPKDVFTKELLANVFSVNSEVILENNLPYIKIKSLL